MRTWTRTDSSDGHAHGGTLATAGAAICVAAILLFPAIGT